MRWKFAAMALPWGVWLLLLTSPENAAGQTGFASLPVSNQWNEVVGLTFTEEGDAMFVWERAGRVYTVVNGTKSLLLDLSEEVGGWHDHGLLGFALHPHFDENPYIYLLYVVDRHHLLSFGTGLYNPAASDYYLATIGRLTRYTVSQNQSGGYSITPGSRKILLGETKSTGIPILSITHSVGTLLFGTDHTLLVSTGDGASPNNYDAGSYNESYYVQALADNIISEKENVGAFRSQLVDCLNGKILRIDPETGNGIPSNPFYDPARPDRPASKVWALGLRNPFRMVLKPGTGSHTPEDGNPGTIYLGDVGWVTWEELNLVDGPGQNFGWPIYEGLTALGYAPVLTANKDAPNPLYQVGGCNQPFFNFQDLIKQATPSGTSTFPNPCNGTQSVPSTIPTFVHKRPMIDWQHGTGPSRTGIFNGQNAAVINIGAAGSPVAGPQFGGSAAIGGAFYTGTDFPAEFQNTFFFADFSGEWIKNLAVNENNQPVEVKNFVDNGAIVVHMTTHPTQEGLYYVNFPSEIRRIVYTSNRPPTAVATADKVFGSSPLGIQFTGSQSSDPEDAQLTYEWNFGDGSPLENTANPLHTFTKEDGTPGMFTVSLKVTDPAGAADITTLVISINNTPPDVEIISPQNNTLYPLTGETVYTLQATVSDDEHSAAQLTYQWQTVLHHETHQHPEPIDNSPQSTTSLAPVGCDGESYYYSITLTVTDAAGAATTKEVRLYPDCSGIVKRNPLITWSNPSAITQGTALGPTQLNAIASYNGIPIGGAFEYTPDVGTVLNVGTGQQLSAAFTPSNTILYNPASKNVAIDVLPLAPLTFYRALNLNGAALTIDGNSWQSSIGAANFSFTQTGGGVFANQAVPLVPSTDANRATMIRSSIWGNAVNINVTAVPNGNYDVYVYVWEDNFTQTFSVSVEGTVVVPAYNSGSAGVWSKLGPFHANITDGAINVSANGGHACLSGIEIWTSTPQTTPVVTQPYPDQTLVNTQTSLVVQLGQIFNDDGGVNNLTFTVPNNTNAALISNTQVAGTQLTFTLSGTTGTGLITLRATDAGSQFVEDVFQLTVTDGNAPQLVNIIRINSGGTAQNFGGEAWVADQYFTGGSLFSTASPIANTTQDPIYQTERWGTFQYAIPVPSAGTYAVDFHLAEIYFTAAGARVFNINVENGQFVRNSLDLIQTYGPNLTAIVLRADNLNITDGFINISFTSVVDNAKISGIAVGRYGAPPANSPPVVSNPIADQTATVNQAFNFTVPSNAFSDPNPGTTLTYSASLSNGNPLPLWLTFTPATRAFSGTPASGDTGVLQVRVTVSDGDLTTNDIFSLAVNAPTFTNFYRALNLNGAALTIDGNSWQSSIGATNFSFTQTGGGVFANQAVPLVPATDANRATMIRSSIWGNAVNINVTAVPNGSYDVFVYVWEDNFTQTFSVSLEGTVVVPVYNSGSAGVWSKLGPFRANITDGAINVSANGGHACLSGIEIWTATPQTNPVVLQPYPDQTLVNTQTSLVVQLGQIFNDDGGVNNLTFTVPNNTNAALISNTQIVGTQLTFTLSGTIGTGLITLRATDAGSQFVEDVFQLTVTDGSTPQLVNIIRINSGGAAQNFGGEAWVADQYFTGGSLFSTASPIANTTQDPIYQTERWGTFQYAIPVPSAGTYAVDFHLAEIYFTAAGARVFNINVENGQFVRNSLDLIQTYGPNLTAIVLRADNLNITDGFINISFTAVVDNAKISGIAVGRYGAPPANSPPVVSNPIADQAATVNQAFNFTVPSNAFSDPNPGTTLTYSASLSNGNPLPLWLTFTPATRAFTGTPASGDTGVLQVRVTASDGSLTANDIFSLSVNPPGSTTFYRAINLNGPALVIDGNNWISNTGAPNFSFTSNGVFANQAVPLVPATDANRSTMIRSSVWGSTVNLNMTSVPPGSYQVWLYVWEDNFTQTFSVSLEGSVVQPNFNSGAAGVWTKLGPYSVTINDGAINASISGQIANVSGIEVWSGTTMSGARMATPEVVASVAEVAAYDSTALEAHPNPFARKLNVRYTARQSGHARVELFDVRGRSIHLVHDGKMSAGETKEKELDTTTMPAGLYVLQFVNGNHVFRLKLMAMQ